MNQLQQGDICLTKIDRLPDAKKKPKLERKKGILREGETTGHAHKLQGIEGTDYNIVTADPKSWREPRQMFVEVISPTELTHEEHNTILIEPGIYEVTPVYEYDHFAKENRRVRD